MTKQLLLRFSGCIFYLIPSAWIFIFLKFFFYSRAVVSCEKKVISEGIGLLNLADSIPSFKLLIEHENKHPKIGLMGYPQYFAKFLAAGHDTLVDIGCGHGFAMAQLLEKVVLSKVVMIDHNKNHLDTAKCLLQRFNSVVDIQYLHGDLRDFSYGEYVSPVGFLSNVLEHIEERVDFLKTLSDAGFERLLIRVPSVNRHWLVRYARESSVYYFMDRDHKTEYTGDEIRCELMDAGYEIIESVQEYGEYWIVASRTR